MLVYQRVSLVNFADLFAEWNSRVYRDLCSVCTKAMIARHFRMLVKQRRTLRFSITQTPRVPTRKHLPPINRRTTIRRVCDAAVRILCCRCSPSMYHKSKKAHRSLGRRAIARSVHDMEMHRWEEHHQCKAQTNMRSFLAFDCEMCAIGIWVYKYVV